MLLPLLFMIVSCASPQANLEAVSFSSEFEQVLVQGDDFLITTLQKITDKNAPYVFYIEGDGAAFINKRVISPNPTPKRQMLSKLAEMDDRPNVVYVARPCQYTKMELNPKCNNSYWTGKRLSDDSVASLNAVINKINDHQKPFSLIGFSGGGGVAVLIAARNPKVKDIITIAGNLDIVTFTKYHNLKPMSESLNPIDYAKSINKIPQLHLSGAKDSRIFPFMIENYVKQSESTCVKQKTYSTISHQDGWDKIWGSVYKASPNCY